MAEAVQPHRCLRTTHLPHESGRAVALGLAVGVVLLLVGLVFVGARFVRVISVVVLGELLIAGDAEDLVCDSPVTGVGRVHVAACAEECQLADLGSVDDLGGVGDARTVAARASFSTVV